MVLLSGLSWSDISLISTKKTNQTVSDSFKISDINDENQPILLSVFWLRDCGSHSNTTVADYRSE